MIEKYLNQSEEIFNKRNKELKNILPLNSEIIIFNTEDIEVNISQRYDQKENTYSVFGTLVYSDRIFDSDTKLEAINNFFLENQELTNKCISRILSNREIYSEASEQGLFLGNGRSLSSTGLWFIYHTNHYNFSKESQFVCLQKVLDKSGIKTDVPEPNGIYI